MIEAMKHYEAALLEAFPKGASGDVFHHWNEARKAIADAEKQEALQKLHDENERLGLYEGVYEKGPVAWHVDFGNDDEPNYASLEKPNEPKATIRPLVFGDTSPPQRQPLTDEQIHAVIRSGEYDSMEDFARAIEAAHGIKGEA
jgi:hypothetical protein